MASCLGCHWMLAGLRAFDSFFVGRAAVTW